MQTAALAKLVHTWCSDDRSSGRMHVMQRSRSLLRPCSCARDAAKQTAPPARCARDWASALACDQTG
ncbi:hypothetical protein E2562_027352 [Oryza meyeriana var. granulata]|uniref:Uncharacterized protein n=1 Tax=Oryza meyeriana var. granulata TaxID=110450 RepID=A0A6G1E4P7_9ORYZ|nr:hypothetical protein E2562_027352 [Oryza meyeriana var. granulata]